MPNKTDAVVEATQKLNKLPLNATQKLLLVAASVATGVVGTIVAKKIAEKRSAAEVDA